jgi:[ribosomal protein S18]-alanine N-acetyltransferase
MDYTFKPFTEETARAILRWQYEGAYTVYNADVDDAQKIEEGVNSLLDPVHAYYSVHSRSGQHEAGELIGFRCFGADARVPGGDYSEDAIDTGGGLRPDLTGRGLGLGLLQAGLEFGQMLYHPPAFRVTIAAFNLRAQKVCERVGFTPVQRFLHPSESAEFIILVKPCDTYI